MSEKLSRLLWPVPLAFTFSYWISFIFVQMKFCLSSTASPVFLPLPLYIPLPLWGILHLPVTCLQ